jgi:predicted DNA-binding transcriptional regulator AlpA
MVSYEDLMALLRCSRSTIHRMVKRGLLPRPQRVEGLGPRWWEDEVREYLYLLRHKKRPGQSAKVEENQKKPGAHGGPE